MKKAMIGILILVPIIIVLVVSLVSVFVSTRTHIGVENITFDKQSLDVGLSEVLYRLDDLIKVTVLPDKASDKSYMWSIEDVKCLDEDYGRRYDNYIAHMNDEGYAGEIVAAPVELVDRNGNTSANAPSDGYIKVNAYCSFAVVAQAETMSARCLVYVVGYEVEKVTLSAKQTIKVGETRLIDVAYNPVDSIVTEAIWSSSDESVLTVDGNGAITARKTGVANVIMRAKVYDKDEYVESAPLQITVEAGLTALGANVEIATNRVALTALGVSEGEMTDFENCSVVGDDIVIAAGNTQASVKVNGQTVNINVVGSSIKINGEKLYAYDELANDSYILAAGNNLMLSVSFRDMLSSANINPADVSWTSSVPAVASVDAAGKVTGLKRGKSTITASYEGRSASLLIAVEEKITTLILDTTTSSLAIGIAKETVFAASDYVDPTNPDDSTLKNNSVTIGFLRPFAPENADAASAFYKSFNFIVRENGERSDKAYFENNVLVFDREKISGKTVLSVEISAKYPKYKTNLSYTTCTFEIIVTDGVEVNTFAEFQKAAEDKHIVCFGNDIQFRDDITLKCTYGAEDSISINKSLYGNNKTLYAGYQQMISGSMLYVSGDDIVISNVILRANEVGEEISSADEATGLKGDCIEIDPSGGYSEHKDNIRLEYCILENATTAVGIYGVDVEFEGCIIRNMQGTGIYVLAMRQDNGLCYSHVTMTNSVMSNLIGTGFSFHYSGFSNKDNLELAQQDVAEGRNLIFTQKGFLDIYNWQETTVLSLISADTVAPEFYPIIQSANAFIASKVEGDDFADFVSLYQGNKYFHLGFISTGIMEPSFLEFYHEDDRFIEITSDQFGFEIIPNPLRLFSYGGNDKEISPRATYTLNKKLIEKLHGNY